MAEAPEAAETGPALGPLESLAAIKAALSKVSRTGWDDSTIGVRGAVKAAQPSTQSLAQAYAMRGVARPGDSPQTAVKSKHGRQKPPPLPGKRSRALQPVPLATGSDDAGHAAGRGAGNAAEAAKKRFLLPRKRWGELPEWISLPNERGRSLPRLEADPLFEAGPPCLLPFRPPAGAPTGRGAVVVCPGGNYEFLHPREGPPIAAWLSEAHGVPSFVLRYRLLPAAGLDEMLADLGGAVREARRRANGGPVVAVGFSAGGHLIASSVALHGEERPDAFVLVYPCVAGSEGWLTESSAGFFRAEVKSAQVRSLAARREQLCPGAAFVPPPPVFVVASTADTVCPPAEETDAYVRAARDAGTRVEYLRGDYGEHGFGLRRSWAVPCQRWLAEQGLGAAAAPAAEPGAAPAAEPATEPAAEPAADAAAEPAAAPAAEPAAETAAETAGGGAS